VWTAVHLRHLPKPTLARSTATRSPHTNVVSQRPRRRPTPNRVVTHPDPVQLAAILSRHRRTECTVCTRDPANASIQLRRGWPPERMYSRGTCRSDSNSASAAPT
jgi:hypothetical protein